MASPQKILPFILVLVFFSMLLCIRALGLETIMSPTDVRIIYFVELLCGLMALIYIVITAQSNFSTRSQLSNDCMCDKASTLFLSSENSARSLSHFLKCYANVLAIYIFGGGTVALNFAYLYVESQCMPFFVQNENNNTSLQSQQQDLTFEYQDALFQLLTSVTKIIFIVIEIPMLHYMTNVTYRKRRSIITKCCFVILIATNFIIWLATFLAETHFLEVIPEEFSNRTIKKDIREACLNKSSVAELYLTSSVEKTLFPFSMELCIISIEILYHVYFTEVIREPEITVSAYKQTFEQIKLLCANPSNRIHVEPLQRINDDLDEPFESLESRTEVVDEHSALLSHVASCNQSIIKDNNEIDFEVSLPDDEPRRPQKNTWVRVWSILIRFNSPVTALTFGIFEAVLIKMFLIHQELLESADGRHYMTEPYFHSYMATPLVTFCIIFDGMPLLACTLHCYFVIRSFPHKRSKSPAFKNSVTLALLGISILSCFKLIVSCIKVHKYNRGDNSDLGDCTEMRLQILTLIEVLLYWPQYFLQALLIYKGQRHLPDSSHVMFESLQGALSYIAMNNFIHWGISSFLETDYLTHRMEMSKGITTWGTLVHLFTPTFIFYYFISTFLLLDIKTRLSDAGRPWERWSLKFKIV